MSQKSLHWRVRAMGASGLHAPLPLDVLCRLQRPAGLSVNTTGERKCATTRHRKSSAEGSGRRRRVHVATPESRGPTTPTVALKGRCNADIGTNESQRKLDRMPQCSTGEQRLSAGRLTVARAPLALQIESTSHLPHAPPPSNLPALLSARWNSFLSSNLVRRAAGCRTSSY